MPSPLTPSSSQEIIAISPPTRRSPIKRKPNVIPQPSLSASGPTSTSTSKTLSHMSNYASTNSGSSSSSTTLPQPKTFQPSTELRSKIADHVRADKYLQQIGEVDTPGDPSSVRRSVEERSKDRVGSKRKIRQEEVEKERKRLAGEGEGEGEGRMNRERTTQRMVCPLYRPCSYTFRKIDESS